MPDKVSKGNFKVVSEHAGSGGGGRSCFTRSVNFLPG